MLKLFGNRLKRTIELRVSIVSSVLAKRTDILEYFYILLFLRVTSCNFSPDFNRLYSTRSIVYDKILIIDVVVEHVFSWPNLRNYLDVITRMLLWCASVAKTSNDSDYNFACIVYFPSLFACRVSWQENHIYRTHYHNLLILCRSKNGRYFVFSYRFFFQRPLYTASKRMPVFLFFYFIYEKHAFVYLYC